GLETSHLLAHLAVLRQNQVVTSQRRASHVYYRVTTPEIADLLASARRFLTEVVHAKQSALDATSLPVLPNYELTYQQRKKLMKIWQYFRSLLPQARDYAALPRTWRADLMAGLTVGIVALPLALGFGVSSGAGAEAGIITAIV